MSLFWAHWTSELRYLDSLIHSSCLTVGSQGENLFTRMPLLFCWNILIPGHFSDLLKNYVFLDGNPYGPKIGHIFCHSASFYRREWQFDHFAGEVQAWGEFFPSNEGLWHEVQAPKNRWENQPSMDFGQERIALLSRHSLLNQSHYYIRQQWIVFCFYYRVLKIDWQDFIFDVLSAVHFLSEFTIHYC